MINAKILENNKCDVQLINYKNQNANKKINFKFGVLSSETPNMKFHSLKL